MQIGFDIPAELLPGEVSNLVRSLVAGAAKATKKPIPVSVEPQANGHVVRFDLPQGLSPNEVAVLVKCLIEGAAYGWVEPFRRLKLPRLYETPIRFAFEPQHGSGNEDFASPLTTLRRGWGDCDDLVTYRICERAAYDTPPGMLGPTCSSTYVGSQLHVQVRHPDRSLEDPAVNLGAPT